MAKIFLFMFGLFILAVSLIAALILYMIVNERFWSSYAYEVSFGLVVSGEEVQLVAQQICSPQWEYGITSGAPQGYQGSVFSVGRPLAGGGAVFAVVPNICRQKGSNPSFDEWEDVAEKGEVNLLPENTIIYLTDDYDSPREFIFLPVDSGELASEPELTISHATWRALLLESDEMPVEINWIGEVRTALATRINGKHYEPASPEIRTLGRQIWESSDGRFDVYAIDAFSNELYQFVGRWQFHTGASRLPAPIMARRSEDDIVILDALQSRLQIGYASIWRENGLRLFGEDVTVDPAINLAQVQLAIFDRETQNMYFEKYSNLPISNHTVRKSEPSQR